MIQKYIIENHAYTLNIRKIHKIIFYSIHSYLVFISSSLINAKPLDRHLFTPAVPSPSCASVMP